MNAVTTTQPKPTIKAGGQVSALVPQSLDEAFRVASAMAASGMTPKGVDKPESSHPFLDRSGTQCFVATDF